MLKVGDIVRYSNKYLRTVGSRRARDLTRRRGKQRLSVVTRILSLRYNWRAKVWNGIVELDCEAVISIGWLRFVRRPKAVLALGTDGLTVTNKTDGSRYEYQIPHRRSPSLSTVLPNGTTRLL
jgi:hypothetical protein